MIPLHHKMRCIDQTESVGSSVMPISHFVHFRDKRAHCPAVQKRKWLKSNQMEIQHIFLEWMLDFNLERAKERLPVSSNLLPFSLWFVEALGSCGLERELMVDSHETFLHMGKWQAKYSCTATYGGYLSVWRGGFRWLLSPTIHPLVSLFT